MSKSTYPRWDHRIRRQDGVKVYALFSFSLFFFLCPSRASAETYYLNAEVLKNKSQFAKILSLLKPFDTVILSNRSSPTTTFHLGKNLGSGVGGVVFEWLDPNPPQIIKFQFKNLRGSVLANAEVQAHRALETTNIPHARLTHTFEGCCVTKERINGPSLEDALKNWRNISVDIQAAMAVDYELFRESVKKSPVPFSDLHRRNVLFDLHERKWKVIDPGWVSRILRIRTLWLDQDTSLKFEFKAAVKLGRENPAWLRTYLGLQKVIQAKNTSEALVAQNLVDWALLRSPEVPAPVRDASVEARHRLKSLDMEQVATPFESSNLTLCIARGVLFRLRR